MSDVYGCYVEALKDQIKELEAENARLRQQRDSANALLDYVLEEVSSETE